MNRPLRILVVGDVMLDRDLIGTVDRVCPDAPAPVVEVTRRVSRPGGAGLAAAVLAAPGRQLQLATVLGRDDSGLALRRMLAGAPDDPRPVSGSCSGSVSGSRSGSGPQGSGRPAGHRDGPGVPAAVGLIDLLDPAQAPPTRVVTRVRSAGASLVRVDENPPELADSAALDLTALEAAVAGADAVLVSDYGRGVSSHPGVRAVLARWCTRLPVVWDPHPRGRDPLPGVSVVTPSRAEATLFATRQVRGDGELPLDLVAVRLRDAWQVHAVAAKDGAAGVFTALADSPPVFTPTPFTVPGDPVGAGDRFAGAVAAELAGGAVITEAIDRAVEDVAGWLAAGGVSPDGIPSERPAGVGAEPPDGWRLAAAVRARGGSVVATGGCFDVLHAGHIASLQAARRLGDCLVVLLNSDPAITRLKGPDRPVHPVQDRIRVLQSLECVDAVIVFDEDSPAPMLRRLRPDIWAKGGDYAGSTLPEATAVAEHGGRVVLLPYLPGRSTTSIVNATAARRQPQAGSDATVRRTR